MYLPLFLFDHLEYVFANDNSTKRYLIELITRRSKVHEKSIPCKSAINFEH